MLQCKINMLIIWTFPIRICKNMKVFNIISKLTLYIYIYIYIFTPFSNNIIEYFYSM